MRTFKVTAVHWHTEVNVKATAEVETEEVAKTLAEQFPKSARVHGTRCYGDGRVYGLVMFDANLSKPAGIKRWGQFLTKARLLGCEFEMTQPFKNSLTWDQLTAYVAGELTFEEILPPRVEATEPEQVTVTLKLFGEEREVTVEGYVDLQENSPHKGTIWRASVHGFVGTIGRGSARYPTTLLLNRLYEGQSAFNRGTVVTDQAGRKWTYHLGTVIRNRQARIVGWKDRVGATNYQDQERTS